MVLRLANRLASRLSAWMLMGLFLPGCDAPPPAGADHVGSQRCAGCHQDEHRLWRQSHHAAAMAPATVENVLGDFSEVRFGHAGNATRFYRRGDEFRVETPGPDGEPADYRIRYTFGVYPLQQYVIAFPRGHYQVLNIAWDSRPTSEGGQRWFHLYPDEEMTHEDPLHWTGPYHKWNARCAECHSTALQKNYDAGTESYETTWQEIGVGCEACHGAGSKHVAWAEEGGEEADNGLSAPLVNHGQWVFDEGPIASRRNGSSSASREVAVCARCHSRRSTLGAWRPGDAYLDAHVPTLLAPPEYHADGQIDDEVFEAGSFWQSRMFHAGVVCSDCHEPHSGRLQAGANGVCVQCHKAEVFNTAEHHHHEEQSSGALCANCHMPTHTYMVIDERHDHSLRVPDPWLSLEAGTPNACNDCHAEQGAAWAIAALERWGMEEPDDGRYDRLLTLANGHGADAPVARRRLADGNAYPAIVRATVFSLMSLRSEADIARLREGLSDGDALVRLGAVRALDAAPPQLRRQLLWPLLNDSVRAVRLEAVRLLSLVPADSLSPRQRSAYERRLQEYVKAQMFTADFAGSWLNLAGVYVNRGDYQAAEKAYRKAMEREPAFVPAFLNLADLYRMQGRHAEARTLLERALEIAPDDAAAQFSYGLLLVRNKEYDEALGSLKRAAELAPETARYSYTYAVALHTMGRTREARDVAASALRRDPGHRGLQELLSRE